MSGETGGKSGMRMGLLGSGLAARVPCKTELKHQERQRRECFSVRAMDVGAEKFDLVFVQRRKKQLLAVNELWPLKLRCKAIQIPHEPRYGTGSSWGGRVNQNESEVSVLRFA